MEEKTKDPETLKAEVKKLCDEHWNYVKGVLIAGEEPAEPFSTEEKKLAVIEFHYKTAFEHGFKHGKESVLKAVETAQKIINQTVSKMRFSNLKNSVEKQDITNARKVIHDALETDKDLERIYINDMTMFLNNRYKITDPKERNMTAKDLLRIIFY